MRQIKNRLFLKVTTKVKEVVKSFDPSAEVILFGSRARGNYRGNSDWDFLILTDSQVDTKYKDELRDNLYLTELDLTQVVNSIIKNKKEWLNLNITPLFQNISEEGIVL